MSGDSSQTAKLENYLMHLEKGYKIIAKIYLPLESQHLRNVLPPFHSTEDITGIYSLGASGLY